MNPLKRNPDEVFQQVLNVLQEYHLDLDSDIEGCNSDELYDIEEQMEAVRNIKKRLIAHICEGKDVRGV